MTDLIPAGNGHWTLDMWMLWTAPELRHDQANLTLDAVEDEQHRRKIYGAWRRAENQVVESICKTIGETAPRAFGINTYEVLRQDATLENGMWRNDERLEMTPSLLRDHPQPDWRFPFPPDATSSLSLGAASAQACSGIRSRCFCRPTATGLSRAICRTISSWGVDDWNDVNQMVWVGRK